MALVSAESKKTDIPHEPGQFMFLRRISWSVFKTARELNVDEGVDKAKKVGGELMEAFGKMSQIRAQLEEAQAQIAEEDERDPYDPDNYDTATILEAGIDKWSYDTKVSSQSISELDEPTMIWAKRTIIDSSKPRGEEEKKGS